VLKVKESALHDHYALIKLNARTLATMSALESFYKDYYQTSDPTASPAYENVYELLRAKLF